MALRMLRSLAMTGGSPRAYKHAKADNPLTVQTVSTGDGVPMQVPTECVRHGKFQPHWRNCHHCLSEN